MMESQLQDRSVRKHICSWTHCVMDQWSRDGWIKNTILWRRNQLKQIFPDFEMLDAGIASALRKNRLQNLIHKKSQCWRAASSEEQRNSWEGGKLLIWSMATFSQPELMMKLKACQICSIFAYMTMTFRISIQDGTKFRWQQVRYLKRMFLKFCTRRSYRDLKNFQLFWQCTTDNSVEMENRQAIKDWGRWLDNILIRWSGRATSKPGMKEFRQEYWSRVTKGEKSALTGKWEKTVSGRQLDSIQKETPVVSATEVIVDRKHNRPLLRQKRRQTDGRRPSKGFGLRGESPSGLKGRKV